MTQEEIKALFEGNQDAFEDFEKKFNTAPAIIDMKRKIANLQKSFRYVQAMELQRKLNTIEYNTAKDLIEEGKKKVEKVNLLSIGLSDKDRDAIVDMRMCLDMLADAMETFAMDIDDILRKYDNTLSFEEFVPTVQLLREARKKLDWCSKNTDWRKYEPWGNECDKLINYVKNKARVIKRETNKVRYNADNVNSDKSKEDGEKVEEKS